MRDTDYAYAVGNIRANELRLLTKADTDSLISARTTEDALRYLGDKGWNNENASPGDFEEMLTNEMEKAWELVRGVSPDPAVMDLLLYKNDFHNLKVVIKGILLKKEFPQYYLRPYTVDIEEIEDNVKHARFDKLPKMLSQAAKEAYEVLMKTGDGQLCDIIIDRAAIEAILSEAKNTRIEFLINLSELMAATANIKTAVRSCRTGKSLDFVGWALAPCETLNINDMAAASAAGIKELAEYLSHTDYSDISDLVQESSSSFEKWCDDKIIDFAKSAKYETFGVSPLVAYILARETEIKAVRIILSGKYNKLPVDAIRERLRELYV